MTAEHARSHRAIRAWSVRVALAATSLAIIASCERRPPTSAARPGTPPKLVILVAVDGLGAELLTRYNEVFTGGLRRLADEGLSFTDATVDHGITVSHAGHVTLATGAHPAHHGIVDAAFYAPTASDRELVDAVADPAESILGDPAASGASPRRVLLDGLAEWATVADPAARALAVGSGWISSLLYAFHTPAEVYWYSRPTGRYVTSSYYREALPAWVDEFNAAAMPAYLTTAARWECAVDPAWRRLARSDDTPIEAGGTFTTFPHLADQELETLDDAGRAQWLGWNPVLDVATLELATRGIDELGLGRRGATDVLTIVLSQVDTTSHYYGPHSLEVLDVLVRLDRALGEFLASLDRRVGRGQWVLALSADHGFPEIPELRRAAGLPGTRLTGAEIEPLLAAVAARGDDPEAVAAAALRRPFIAAAYTPAQLAGDSSGDPMLRLYQHSWRPDRTPRLPLFSLEDRHSAIAEAGVMVRLTEGTIIDLDIDNHGSPYDYDRRVPLVLVGGAVAAGSSVVPARTVDVAPTLAAIAGIPVPAGRDGRALAIE